MSLRSWITGVCASVLLLASLAAQAQTVRYIHTDALGSPVAVTNASRTVIEVSEYEPYGRVVNRPVKPGPGYTGHVMDVSTGLAYMQQRYYDPNLGRFLSVDPVTAHASTGANFNRYWYANNNPYRFTDPDGRQACEGKAGCIEASNYEPNQASNQTVTQSADVDIAAGASSNMPGFETTGNAENVVRLDETASGTVKVTSVEATTTVNGNVIESSMSRASISGAEAIEHSHPVGTSDPSPGPGDDAVVNAGFPNNVVHNGNVVVVEKVQGQFRVRVLRDNNLTSGDQREIQRDVNLFQQRSQQ